MAYVFIGLGFVKDVGLNMMSTRQVMILLKNLLFAFLCAFLAYDTVLSHDVHSKIEPYLQEDYLDSMIEQVENLSEKYLQPDYIDQLVCIEQTLQQKKRDHNNRLLYEIALSRFLPIKVPHIGIYTKDLFKFSFVSLDWVADWVLYRNLKEHFFILLFKQLTSSDTLLSLLQDESKTKEDLYAFVQKELRIPYADLCSGPLFTIIGKHFIANQCTKMIKDHFLVQDAKDDDPIALFSLVEEHLFTSLILNLPQAGFLTWANDFFKSRGYLSPLVESNVVYCAQKIAFSILFIGWFNQNVVISQWTNYLAAHREELVHHLVEYHALKKSRLSTGGSKLNVTQLGSHQASTSEALKQFIGKGQELSFMTWIKFKNMKQAEWEFCYNLIISLPGWYRITQVAYNIGKQLLQEQPMQSE